MNTMMILMRRRVVAFMTIGFLVSFAPGGLAFTANDKSAKPAAGQSAPLPAGAAMRLGGRTFQQQSGVQAVAVSPDGKLIVSGEANRPCVHLWDAATGEEIRRLATPPGGSMALTFSPDGQTLAAAASGTPSVDEARIFLWSLPSWELRVLSSGKPKASYPYPRDPRPHGFWLYGVDFSPDGKKILAGGERGETMMWDVATGAKTGEWVWHPECVTAVAFSPDGQKVASGDLKGNLCLAEPDSDREPLRISAAKRSLNALTFSADGRWVISGGTEELDFKRPQGHQTSGSVKVWDAATGKLVRELGSAEKDTGVQGFAWSPDHRTLAAAYQDKTIRLWDPAAGRELQKIEGRNDSPWGPCQMAFTPDGTRLVSGGQGNVVAIWDVGSGQRLFDKPDAHTGAVNSLAFSSDGRTLVSGGSDRTVRFWDLPSGRQHLVLETGIWQSPPVFSRDGRIMALRAFGKRGASVQDPVPAEAEIREAASGKVLSSFSLVATLEDLTRMALSPTGDVLAVGYGETMMASGPAPEGHPVRLWNAKTGEKLGELPGHVGGVAAMSFAADGRSLVVVAGSGAIRVWDLASQTELQKIETKEDSVGSPTISADQRRIAWRTAGFNVDLPGVKFRRKQVVIKSPAGGPDRVGTTTEPTILVWDLPQDGHVQRAADLQVHLLEGSEGSFMHLALSADGKRLVAANLDRKIQVWDVETSKVVGEAAAPESGGRIDALDLDPQGRTVAAGFEDGTILLWPLENLLQKK